ncbi:hypothetical protein [Lentibacillus salinarum]|uniref:Uncharacterized protein n=1 Tax=Lentibacillus salinarum TaxID=446820 RepID=A0ABW3ZS87_9BACI
MIRLSDLKASFQDLKHLSKHERMVQVCGLLTAYFQQDNIQPIIVGG